MTRVLIATLYVGAGGFAGSIVRYLLTLAAQRVSLVFPYGTLASNFGGCFLIGCFVYLGGQTTVLSPAGRLLLMTGFCGGFTTMSSMINETVQFVEANTSFQAGTYLLLSIGGSLLAFYLGALVMKLVLKTAAGIYS
jgi:CrcB protein